MIRKNSERLTGERRECERLPKCPFFAGTLRNMPAMSDLLREYYCKGKWNECARYMVAKELGGGVPDDLFPQDRERASQIIRDFKGK